MDIDTHKLVTLFNALMHEDALADFHIDVPRVDASTRRKCLDYFAALGIPPRYIRFA